eukprot:TRINITY_DN2662_c0_g1_i12.p1 TRINITY_DN2662_c0_g1~~TRINITY_DN2662_c0_g1_i12.p1  ORF type:complete len:128 (+),score=16.37 TRINITY_DN2662_c0_g1_i12:10-393(+)
MHRSLTLLIYVFLPVLVAVSVVRVSLIFFCVLFIDIQVFFFFFLMIRRPPRSTHCISSAASDVYKRQTHQSSKIIKKRSIECKVRKTQGKVIKRKIGRNQKNPTKIRRRMREEEERGRVQNLSLIHI